MLPFYGTYLDRASDMILKIKGCTLIKEKKVIITPT